MPTRAWIVCVSVLSFAAVVRGDAFDHYTNAILPKAPEATGVKELAELPSETILEHADAIPGVQGALIIVYTNDSRWAKLLVNAAAQKFQTDPKAPADIVPMLRI